MKPSKTHTASPSVVPASTQHLPVVLSFKHFGEGGVFCLSRCDQDEVRMVMSCFRRMTTMSWTDLIATGGKHPQAKHGLHCTKYEDAALTGVSRPVQIDPALPMLGVRASEAFRVFGVRSGQIFFVLWFDRTHAICPV
jgi:hypothetical protein